MLKGKIAVITGGSRGIGKAIAIKFAKLGADIAINYVSSSEKADEVIREIKSHGVEAAAFKCDVSNSVEVQEMINKVKDKWQRIDILVNNAGITKDGIMLRMKEEDFNQVVDINLKGVFNCIKHTGTVMVKQRRGNIINISSVVALIGNPGQINYTAAKAGVLGMTKTAAKELSKRGIRVNAIAPGFIQTDMTETLKPGVKESMLDSIPLNRFGKPEDVANLCAFLACDESSYITGQVINVDGGMVM